MHSVFSVTTSLSEGVTKLSLVRSSVFVLLQHWYMIGSVVKQYYYTQRKSRRGEAILPVVVLVGFIIIQNNIDT
jgi:glucan phosphoethanolaminetransferase (alkaline phosphatase superfamily)